MEKIIAYICVIIGVFACSCSQLLLKRSATNGHDSLIKSMLNWKVLASYSIFIVSIIINITAFKYGVNVKDIPILESLGYIFVPFLSFLVLKEKMNRQTFFAIIIILAGVVTFYL